MWATRPLDQAVQHATTELLKWLYEDYGLDYRAGSLLVGQCLRYDVGNVFDPAYTMIAKLEKRCSRRTARGPEPRHGGCIVARGRGAR